MRCSDLSEFISKFRTIIWSNCFYFLTRFSFYSHYYIYNSFLLLFHFIKPINCLLRNLSTGVSMCLLSPNACTSIGPHKSACYFSKTHVVRSVKWLNVDHVNFPWTYTSLFSLPFIFSNSITSFSLNIVFKYTYILVI